MKRLWSGLVAGVVFFQLFCASAYAIDTTPSIPPNVDGPLMITGYSFSGHTVRYVQIYNSSSEIASLDGWKIATEWSTSLSWQSSELAGMLAPKHKVIASLPGVVSGALFDISGQAVAADPKVSAVKLVPPVNSGFNEHLVSVTTTASTVNVATSPATYYFSRNISSSTGNFLTTFTAFVPSPTFHLEQDELYQPLASSPLQIVELYPDAMSCAPNDVSILCKDYVKIQNISSHSIDLAKFRIRVGSAGQSASSSNTSYPTGLLEVGAYVAVPLALTDSGSWVWIEDLHGIQRYDETIISYPSASGHAAWAYSYNSSNGLWQWTQYPTPYNQQNQFAVEGIVNECDGLKLSEIGANYSPQFIEVYNPSGVDIDISGCQLQTNRSQTKKYTFPLDTKLSSLSTLAIIVPDTELELTKTTTGTVYILNSYGTTEVDVRNYEDLDENTSLSLVGGKWLQTFTVTPGAENSYAEYPPCESGYERNIETGRCNKVVATPTLTPCLPTQYRSPDTNRCRNLTTASSSLTPCKAGQYRSPETNRCRSLTSATSTLKPCGPNQERNTLTNRCRNKVKAITADFPVEAVADAGQGTLGWWAFGGVGILAAGYAGWEWRREAMSLIKKSAGFFISGR